MRRRTNFSIILLACFSLSLLNTGIVNAAQKIHGKVTEIIDVAGYTYAEVDTGKEKIWAAGPTTPLKTGDTISFSSDMLMKNFHSEAMGRDFPVIYFINSYLNDEGNLKTTAAHSQLKQQNTVKPIKGINKAEGGKTIAEIHSNRINLKDKTLRVRGQVTKFTANILNKNWLHIRDSSTLDDLTVITNDTAAVGDIVIAEGRLELDKDFNYGYFYPVILLDSTITKE
ncbi:MAG: hypothetical protein GQ549_01850 [Gammaproteobacteria bacterium]|nr:hypothetical protein [Gammaproteobacteria bacterium]